MSKVPRVGKDVKAGRARVKELMKVKSVRNFLKVDCLRIKSGLLLDRRFSLF